MNTLIKNLLRRMPSALLSRGFLVAVVIGGGVSTISNISAAGATSLGFSQAIDAGWSHSLVVKNDGTVWSFGLNRAGQLGRAANAVINQTPQIVNGLTDIRAVAGGSDHSLALKSDGTVWTFGNNARMNSGVPRSRFTILCPESYRI